LAALFLRAFFLRDFFAIVAQPSAKGMGYRHRMADEIRAEMVANVWKVVKSPGDEVAEGDTLVILESMKMEIPVIAESEGVVTEIAVSEGDVIQEGDLIAVIE
jgi:biotin carboxyl carrier protein